MASSSASVKDVLAALGEKVGISVQSVDSDSDSSFEDSYERFGEPTGKDYSEIYYVSPQTEEKIKHIESLLAGLYKEEEGGKRKNDDEINMYLSTTAFCVPDFHPYHLPLVSTLKFRIRVKNLSALMSEFYDLLENANLESDHEKYEGFVEKIEQSLKTIILTASGCMACISSGEMEMIDCAFIRVVEHKADLDAVKMMVDYLWTAFGASHRFGFLQLRIAEFAAFMSQKEPEVYCPMALVYTHYADRTVELLRMMGAEISDKHYLVVRAEEVRKFVIGTDDDNGTATDLYTSKHLAEMIDKSKNKRKRGERGEEKEEEEEEENPKRQKKNEE